jgi:urease gamma subunit
MGGMERKRYTIRMEAGLARRMERAAELERCSVNTLVHHAVLEYLRQGRKVIFDLEHGSGCSCPGCDEEVRLG